MGKLLEAVERGFQGWAKRRAILLTGSAADVGLGDDNDDIAHRLTSTLCSARARTCPFDYIKVCGMALSSYTRCAYGVVSSLLTLKGSDEQDAIALAQPALALDARNRSCYHSIASH